jgi:hypothetical protein
MTYEEYEKRVNYQVGELLLAWKKAVNKVTAGAGLTGMELARYTKSVSRCFTLTAGSQVGRLATVIGEAERYMEELTNTSGVTRVSSELILDCEYYDDEDDGGREVEAYVYVTGRQVLSDTEFEPARYVTVLQDAIYQHIGRTVYIPRTLLDDFKNKQIDFSRLIEEIEARMAR